MSGFPCERCLGHGIIVETYWTGQDGLFPEQQSAEFVCGARFPFLPAPEEPVNGICYAGCTLPACHRCGAAVLAHHVPVCDACRLLPYDHPIRIEPRPREAAQ